MQDRFKFRVWCKTCQEWEKDEICITNKGQYIITNTNPKFTKITNIDPKYHEINFCTGRKDKNDKLIYEKDIIQCSYANEKIIGVVVWDAVYTQFSICYNNSLYAFVPKRTLDKIEIIGNVYETPELLKGNKNG